MLVPPSHRRCWCRRRVAGAGATVTSWVLVSPLCHHHWCCRRVAGAGAAVMSRLLVPLSCGVACAAVTSLLLMPPSPSLLVSASLTHTHGYGYPCVCASMQGHAQDGDARVGARHRGVRDGGACVGARHAEARVTGCGRRSMPRRGLVGDSEVCVSGLATQRGGGLGGARVRACHAEGWGTWRCTRQGLPRRGVGDSEVRMSGHATQRGRGPGGLFGFAASAIILLRYIFCVSQSEYEKKKQEGTHCSSSHRSLSLEVPGSFASTNGRSRSMNFCVSVRMWTFEC
jgi:hypothetical protein